MTLPSGTKIRGVVLAAEPQVLIFDVTGTSNAKEIPKGMASLPRASVTRMEATKCSGKTRLLLTLAVPASLLTGVAAAMNVQARSSRGGAAEAGVLAAAGIGGGFAGYYLGKSLDCRVTQIVVGE